MLTDPKPKPNDAVARPAILRATVEVKRAKTGKVETYELTGYPDKDQPKKEQDK